MWKIFRFAVILLFIGFVAIQFSRPQKNLDDNTSGHIFNVETVPENIQTILTNACVDCHSNNTNYLWYHNIAPVSWMVAKHVKDGKEELNFSEWNKLDVFSKITMLEEVCQESKRKTMPLKSYTYLHPKAKLSDEELELLCEWSAKLSEELLENASNTDY